jgi:uncharacterized protein (DUF2147 family)
MNKKVALFSAIVAAVFSINMVLFAQQAASPVGIWKTVDDETGKEKSWLQIWDHEGKLYGKVTKILDKPNEGKDEKCDKCTGDKKDKPIIGMVIMWGLSKENDTTWTGGKIMDPNNGKTYRCTIELQNNGAKLRVRGYIGFSLLGRNQFWYRIK